MKGMLKLKLIWIVVDDCLDLPSLTTIQCQGYCWSVHEYIGRVILEGMTSNDLI